jgi:N-acetylglucosamine-6-sulfatase
VGRFPRRLVISGLATLAVTVALAIAGSGTSSPTLGQAATQARPNVIVIETDDQTLESMKVMANVNSLIGDQGATFRRNYTNYSLCCPSRATFMTGQYMHNHGVTGNKAPGGGFSRFEELHADNNLAVWLRNAGYYTAMVGKYLNGYSNQPRVPPGWSEWHATAPGDQKVYNYTLNNDGTLVSYGEDPADFKQDVITGKAVGLVNRRAPKDQPFFMWLTYSAPHVGYGTSPNPPTDCDNAAIPAPRHAHAFDSQPLPRPPNFNEADVSDKPAQIRNLQRLDSGGISFLTRRYRCELESLLSVDEGVRDVVQSLAAAGELNNTLLIYTSDNGFFHGEHRIPGDKLRLYEESTRVPLEMRGPGIPKGVSIGQLSINADLAPTVLDAANATAGLTIDGRSLLPVAQHPGIAAGRQLLLEQPTHLKTYPNVPGFVAIRTGRYIYAEHTSGEKELYDLQDDPYELQSLHNNPAYASVRSDLATRLHQLEDCAGPSCRATP